MEHSAAEHTVTLTHTHETPAPMGSALSCVHAPSVSGDAQQPAAPPAMVIATDGSLGKLPISDPPLASVSDVLGSADAAASPAFFVYNSDASTRQFTHTCKSDKQEEYPLVAVQT